MNVRYKATATATLTTWTCILKIRGRIQHFFFLTLNDLKMFMPLIKCLFFYWSSSWSSTRFFLYLVLHTFSQRFSFVDLRVRPNIVGVSQNSHINVNRFVCGMLTLFNPWYPVKKKKPFLWWNPSQYLRKAWMQKSQEWRTHALSIASL